MREITTHVFGVKASPVLVRTDGHGTYEIRVHHGDAKKPVRTVGLPFQKGLASEVPNGITVESLVAVCMDQLQEHQKGDVSCSENVRAIDGLAAAMAALHERTARRTALGIEGTMRTAADVESERVAALADRSKQLLDIIVKCNQSEPVTAGDLKLLEQARRDGSLSKDTQGRITDALVKADTGGLLIDSEV